MNRREFLKTLGAGLPATTWWIRTASSQTLQSPVVQVNSEHVWQDGTLDAAIVRQMVDAALLELTQKETVADAWKAIVSSDDVVGIKVNPAAGPQLCTHREIVDHVIEGLKEAGVPETQILIWDRFEEHLLNCGYSIRTELPGIRCYATDKTGPGYDPRVFYDTDEDLPARREDGSSRSHFSKIVTQDVTRIINLPVLKQHVASGVSLALKNLAFGSVNNTRRFHGNPVNCDPAIAEICHHAALRRKLAVNLLDGLRGCFDKGPGFTEAGTWSPGVILASFDPVALDATAIELIEARRKEARLPSIQGRARHINTAARLGVGTNNPDEIDIRERTV